jgi:hypothetical protein
MTTYDRTVEEFVALIKPEIEANVDAQIAAEPDPEGRQLLMSCRSIIVGKMLDAIKIANLERRLAEAAARLKPRLVEN